MPRRPNVRKRAIRPGSRGVPRVGRRFFSDTGRPRTSTMCTPSETTFAIDYFCRQIYAIYGGGRLDPSKQTLIWPSRLRLSSRIALESTCRDARLGIQSPPVYCLTNLPDRHNQLIVSVLLSLGAALGLMPAIWADRFVQKMHAYTPLPDGPIRRKTCGRGRTP